MLIGKLRIHHIIILQGFDEKTILRILLLQVLDLWKRKILWLRLRKKKQQDNASTAKLSTYGL